MRNRWLGVGVVVLLAGGVWGVGCGSSDSDGGGAAGGGAAGAAGAGGSGGGGGTAGTDSGAEAAAGSGGSSEAGTDAKKDAPAEAAPTMCGGQTCSGTNIAGAIDIPACCATSAGEAEVCGLDVSQLSIIGINPPNPCIAKNQPGAEDVNCPDYCFSTQLGDVTLKGCMNTESNTCGALANALSVAGLTANVDLGCVTPEQLALPPGGQTCGDGGTTEAGTEAGPDAADDGATDDGATDDGATDDGATDDGPTE